MSLRVIILGLPFVSPPYTTLTIPSVHKLFLVAILYLSACAGESETTVILDANESELRELLNVPEHFSLPNIPEFNIPTAAKIDLGRHLFYDKRLSGNQSQSCASCHTQSLAFSDGEVTPHGSTDEPLVRNSQSLSNAVYHASFTWSNDGFHTIEEQLQIPLRSDSPIELGVTETVVGEVLERFNKDPAYQEKFLNAFPNAATGATINKIIHALASFSRSLISGSSPYDDYLLGDEDALTEQEKRGLALFNGEKFECFHCHSGINFSTSYRDNNSNPETQTFPFFNNGLYNIDGLGDYPAQDQGLYELTQRLTDRGFFRPQSLRNIAITAPYMHDGSLETLRDVLLHYARGGRLIESGAHAGDGRLNPLKSGLIRGFDASEEELNDVEAFLESLTDLEFITNPLFSDPFENKESQ